LVLLPQTAAFLLFPMSPLPCRLPQVVVGDQPISFDAYCKYSDTNNDELPLYL